jgi:hypothetical protein
MMLSMRTRLSLMQLLLWICLAWACAVLTVSPARSQEPYRDVPVHSHYSTAEQGWTCNDGFRQLAGFCVQDAPDLPSQGPFEAYDGQWRCRSGYQRAGTYCVIPSAPAHASLVEAGGRWECDWGYRRVAVHCEEISPPPHAYLDASGHDWVCYPGFERNADHCIPGALKAPEEQGTAPAGTSQPATALGARPEATQH